MFRLDDRNVLYSDVYGQVLDRKKTTYCVEKLENWMRPNLAKEYPYQEYISILMREGI